MQHHWRCVAHDVNVSADESAKQGIETQSSTHRPATCRQELLEDPRQKVHDWHDCKKKAGVRNQERVVEARKPRWHGLIKSQDPPEPLCDEGCHQEHTRQRHAHPYDNRLQSPGKELDTPPVARPIEPDLLQRAPVPAGVLHPKLAEGLPPRRSQRWGAVEVDRQDLDARCAFVCYRALQHNHGIIGSIPGVLEAGLLHAL
mmetsp:Transcript_83414/g.231505  ORF Transcript_83414/g.231505 Transcript_83414/m.231505 type:complete len:201 (-) Transcript_83414:529-1131(-)